MKKSESKNVDKGFVIVAEKFQYPTYFGVEKSNHSDHLKDYPLTISDLPKTKPFFIQNMVVLSENEKTFTFEADFYFADYNKDGSQVFMRFKMNDWPIEHKEYILKQSAQRPHNTK